MPSAEGGFVGKTFFTTSTTDWDSIEDYGFHISVTQDSKITIWDLDTKGKIIDSSVKGGEGIVVQPKANAILVQSTEPITLEWLANGTTTRLGGDAYGGGIAYIGVKPNEETPFFLSTNSTIEAYIFAFKQTMVSLDDSSVSIDAGSYFVLTTPGAHIISSDQNIVIEILSWPLYPNFQGLNFGGVQIPSVQTVDIVVDVTLTPLGEGFPITYIIIGAAAAAICVIVAFIFIRDRGKK